jgi:hypothetical protein
MWSFAEPGNTCKPEPVLDKQWQRFAKALFS